MSDENASTPTLHVHRADDAPAAPPPAAPTPTETVVAGASKVATVTDAKGRTLTLRKLNAMNRLDLAVILGVNSSNMAVASPCALAMMVTHIDGEREGQPNTYNEMRALVGRLDDEGLEAITAEAIRQGWAHVDGDDATEAAAVKNS